MLRPSFFIFLVALKKTDVRKETEAAKKVC